MPESERASRRPPSDALSVAIEAARKSPDNAAHWELVEELVDTAQRPSDVRELFREVLDAPKLPAEVASQIGQRAVRFYEAWYGEDAAELAHLLSRVLEKDQNADWAFERLTVALTAAERWTDLLVAYDVAIEHADDTQRQIKLLGDAAQLAKDFAAQPDRAIGYMTQLYALEPENAALASSLERLLERQTRWLDLISLWRSRVDAQPPRQQRDTYLRMASCYLDALRDPASALRELERVLKDAPDYKPALELAERVLVADGSRSQERRVALRYLREYFVRSNLPNEVIRVLEQALVFTTPEDRRALLRELVERSIELRDDARAMQHQASLLVLDPLPRERDSLRSLAERTRNYQQYTLALAQAARACNEATLRVELLMEAARLHEEQLGQVEQAIEFYYEVFRGGAGADSTVQAGRRLLRLLEQTDRLRDTLDVLSRMSELEPVEAVRKTLLGKLAQLAEKLGERDRARKAWNSRVGDDSNDLEALDALIGSAARDEDHAALAGLLRQRAQAPGAAHLRHEDLVRLARVQDQKLNDLAAAIETWREVRAEFGDDESAVTALAELLSRAERWSELAEVLRDAAQREVHRFTELQTKLGDAYRARLGKPELAVLRYRTALQADPAYAEARAGQQALLEHPACRAIAVSSLVEAYQHEGDWQNALALLEPRLQTAPNDDARVAILIEAAKTWEERGQDPEQALANYRRAFTLAADDRDTEREIRRLAEQLGRWEAVVAAYRDTIGSFSKLTPRVAQLRFAEGQTLETRLQDASGALAAYSEAVRISPERDEFASAAARLAAQLGHWEHAARELVACSAAKGCMPAEAFQQLDRAARDASAWDELCAGLDEVLRVPPEQLGPRVRRDLLRHAAQLHKEQRGDLSAAERALLSASAIEAGDRETLLELATVQRTLRSPRFVATLKQLADVERDSVDALWEAAEAASDPAEARPLFAALYERAVFLWRRGTEPTGQRKLPAAVAFAVERSCALYRAEQQPERALELLIEAAHLPFEAVALQALLHEAAALAANVLGAVPRAILLYCEILEREPGDPPALAALAKLYAQSDRLPDLLALRRHELRLDPKGARRLELRLEITRLLGELDARGDRLSSLQQNLAEQPGHKPSLDALNVLLRDKGQHAELVRLFEAQARVLTGQGHRSQAAWLWGEVAGLREHQLLDPRAALAAYRELHELAPESDASASVARLYATLDEHALAAEWLEVRLGTAPADQRATTAVALARAHVAAAQNTQARACLEQALLEHPNLVEARDLLAELYRQDGAHELLAQVLSQGAELLPEPARRLAYLREAADLYCGPLGAPERAIPVLTRATELAPDDIRLRGMLAEGLRVAGRYNEAKLVLKALVDSFGRKRSPERAEFHFQSARVSASAGQFDEAFTELEQATKMDLGHQAALHMLANLAQQQGDLDRAERAYRGLLLLLRRQKSDADDALGPAEVLFELYRIALARQQQQAADELLASALEAATQTEIEARRFSRVLRARGAIDLLLRVLNTRLAAAREPKVEAGLLAEKADILEHEQKKLAPALELRLRSVALDEHSDELHAATLELAVKADELPRYLDVLSKLADEAVRTRTPSAARSHARHTLRLGRVIEEQLKDFERAASLYAKVEASGECAVESWFALARVAGARGDHAEQRRVLQRISELDDAQASKEERSDARFRVAELELDEPSWREQGVRTLQEALNQSNDYPRAKAVLATALDRAPDHTALLGLCERVARVSNDEPLLLTCIERRAVLQGANLSEVREGIEIALRRSDPTRAERLLQCARSLFHADRSVSDDPTWVFSGLAQCRLQAKDTPGAMGYLREAVESAPEHEAQALARELAELASGPDGDLSIAAETYLRLLEREPADCSLWEPMLHVLMRQGDRARLENFVASTLSALLMVEDCVFLQLAYANYLLSLPDDSAAAVVLGRLLEEDPAHLDATDKLLALYQRHGMHDELLALLQQQFDRARDERNVSAICELGLRLAALYGSDRRDQACDALRAALEWEPDHRELLLALLSYLPDDMDPRERAELMMRVLKSEQGQRAVRLALDLAARFEELNDDDRVREALEYGHRNCPDEDKLRERLEAFYSERELFRPLAELMQQEAARLGTGVAAIARLKNAASLYRDQLQDVEGAAGALRAALALDPNDLSLLGELARNLAAAGQHAAAIADVTRLLDAHTQADDGRVALLRVRADLALVAERPLDALVDIEEAHAIAGESILPDLLSSLARARDAARSSGDNAMVRSTSLRLVAMFEHQGDLSSARDELASLSEVLPDDVEILAGLRQRDLASERYDEVVKSSQRLVALTQGEARVEAVLGLAEAHEKLGHSEAALPWLVRVHEDSPEIMALRDRLRQLFTQMGQQRDLALLLMGDAAYQSEPAEKLASWQRAAELFLALGEAETATDPLQKAMAVAPDDDRTRLLLVDINLSLGRVDEALVSVEQAIGAHKRRRSPELAQFQQRMARICALRGDTDAQLKWLNTALDTDRKSGEVASELVEAAMAIEDHETAMKALRTLTMMEDPRPITRALAFLKQAEIALIRNDVQRAQHWARKAKSLDENLVEADELLARIGGLS